MTKKTSTTSAPIEPRDVLYRVKRGVSAYVSYLAACEMNQAFSEYVLYEPILRILMARGYSVSCEYECPGIAQPRRGDRKRIDFHAIGHGVEMAIEVKWAKNKKPAIGRDMEKLEAFQRVRPHAVPLLCIFGRRSHIANVRLPEGRFSERGTAVIADLRKTRYSCRVFELKPPE